MLRNVIFLTGIRSEYDILVPVIAEVDKAEGLRAGIIVTGAHLSRKFGYSVSQIEEDGFKIVSRIDSLEDSDSLVGRVEGAARQLPELARVLEREQATFLVVMGDREESITGALAAAYMKVPVVHIGGGDHATDGNVDNLIRHAVTKLSHLHMTASERSSQRVRALGEEPWRVHTVGASGLDRLLATPQLSRSELMSRLWVDWSDDYIVVLYHPMLWDFDDAGAHVKTILDAVNDTGLKSIIMFPNSDPGSHSVIEAIKEHVQNTPGTKAFAYLPRILFVNLLRQARALVGNSSAGIIEAPSLKLSVVNIGPRQVGREHGDNVIFVDYDPGRIRAAVSEAVSSQTFRARVVNGPNPYGDGTASSKIAAILRQTVLGKGLLIKEFVDK
jgi:GDP/UDP-N,N'-diacetylbacillosamine 2-epimerase (hydrolysing)